jgi:hypothetical protein
MNDLKVILSASQTANKINAVFSNANTNLEKKINGNEDKRDVTLEDVMVKYNKWWF